MHRRDLLRWGLFGAGSSAMSGIMAPFQALAAARQRGVLPVIGPDEKAVIIFLRGAYDALAAFYPTGDMSADTERGELKVLPGDRLPMSASIDGYCEINKLMAPLVQQRLGDTGNYSPDAENKLAVVYRVGNPASGRSHFTEQQILETATMPTPPSNVLSPEGFVPRLSVKAGFPSTLPMISLAPRQQRLFATQDPARLAVHMKSLGAYSLDTVDGPWLKPALRDCTRKALEDHLGQTFAPGIASQVADTHSFMVDTELLIAPLRAGFSHDAVRFPRNDDEANAVRTATLWALPNYDAGYTFARRCEEALYLLRNTTCQVIGLDLGGWDTHTDQVERLGNLLPWLAYLLRSLYDELKDTTTTIMAISEFGRQIRPNSGNGCDHGIGGASLLLGSTIKPGVYNCHGGGGKGALWRPLNTPPVDGLDVVIHFQTLLAEWFYKRYGLTHAEIDFVTPGWNVNRLSGNPIFTFQNVFRGPHIIQP
jgi:uncharacterized protein (DUF1501 family)